MLRQNAASNVAANAALANYVDRLGPVELAQAIAQIIDGNVYETIDMPALILPFRTNIEQLHAAIAWQVGLILPMPLRQYAAIEVLDHKARHIDGILRR